MPSRRRSDTGCQATNERPMSSSRLSEPLTFVFADAGVIPNNPLPFLVYRGALDLSAARDPAAAIEQVFEQNGWGHGMWRDGIFPFVHYHSQIHEALGIAQGQARVRFGGDGGEVLDVSAGDIAVLPA